MFRARQHEKPVRYRSQTPNGVCFVVAICNCAGLLHDNAWPVSRDFQNKIEAVEVKGRSRGVAKTSHLVNTDFRSTIRLLERGSFTSFDR